MFFVHPRSAELVLERDAVLPDNEPQESQSLGKNAQTKRTCLSPHQRESISLTKLLAVSWDFELKDKRDLDQEDPIGQLQVGLGLDIDESIP